MRTRSPQIVEELFGENMHAEVVKRAGPILSFLGERGSLTPEHVTLIFDAVRGKHEATVLVRTSNGSWLL